MRIDVSPLKDAIDRYIAKADKDLEETLEEEGFAAAAVAVTAINAIEDGVTEALQSHVDEVLEQLQESTGVESFVTDIWPDIESSDDLKKALHDIFRQRFDDLLHQFTVDWIIAENPDFPAVDNRITKPSEAFIRDWSQELARLMQLNTHQQIESILLDADAKKQTVDEVAQVIADSGIRECGYRARRVAVTEVLRVESYAQQEAMVQNPLCYKKKWRHVDNQHPRENHEAIDGQEVFKRESFTLVGRDGNTYHPMCPRDTSLPAAESINCHCRMESVSNDNAIGWDKDELLRQRGQTMDEVDAEWDEAHATDTVDMIKSMERKDQLRYFGGKDGGQQRLSLLESGVISTDKELEKLYKLDESGKRVRKTLQELREDGIFTVSDKALKHTVEGDWTKLGNPKKPPSQDNGGCMKKGGHAFGTMAELDAKGFQYEIKKTYSNGVMIGGYEGAGFSDKKLGGSGMSWFPEEWDDVKICDAGTFVVNRYELCNELWKGEKLIGYQMFANYDGVTVGIFADASRNPQTIYPDAQQRLLGGKND